VTAGELLEAALRLSPLHPVARLARAQHARAAQELDRETVNVGLSRDAVSLGWTARVLRHAGKKDAAIRTYREALEIACRVDHVACISPGFSTDPDVRRYLLPGEPMVLPIVRELVEDTEWGFAEWSAAVPPGSVAELAVARLLQEQGRSEAQGLLESLAESRTGGSASGDEAAIRLAMKAEACALLARWKEAERAYRQAIDEARDLTIRRSWWFNLADVAAQLADERQRDAALQAALGATASDDIGRRVLELQRSSEPLGRLRAGATRAN
jgi:tetratricopeptide (TPR) repeat protein